MATPPQRGIKNELVDDFGALCAVLMTRGLSLGLGMYVKKLSEGSDDTVDAIVVLVRE
jgi:hypothetical protein